MRLVSALLDVSQPCLQRQRETALYRMYSKRKEKQKETDSQPKKKTCTYKEEKERKNGFKDNILLSKKKHMKGRSIQYHANEEARRNNSKRDVLQRRKEKR
jgi:hypothetical protein